MTTPIPAVQSPSDRVFLVATSIVTFFLFFIDEGYCDLRWMKSWGNWVMFGIYGAFIYTGQWVLTRLAWRFNRGYSAYIFGIALGTLLGAGLLILLLLAQVNILAAFIFIP